MKINVFIFFFFFISLKIVFSYPCREISIIEYETNQIFIKKNTTKCVIFTFDNKIEGNIILKLAKSNSFTSIIYLYDNKEKIRFDTDTNEFINYTDRYHIGEEFYKEKKIENMMAQKYILLYMNHFLISMMN